MSCPNWPLALLLGRCTVGVPPYVTYRYSVPKCRANPSQWYRQYSTAALLGYQAEQFATCMVAVTKAVLLLHKQLNVTSYNIYMTPVHRWACLLKRQSSNILSCLPTKENKLPFSASVYRKQTEICHFCLPFAANKRKLPISFSPVFHLRTSVNMETWKWRHWDNETRTLRHKHGDIDMETWTWIWRHDRETWTWRDMDLERHGHGDMDMETLTWRHWHGDMDMETWTWRHGYGDME